MAYHTARLIFTIIIFILALSGLVAGYWFQALFWALVAMAVGYPFIRNGRIDLYYDDAPTKVVYFVPTSAATAPLPAQVAPGAPQAIQQLVQGAL